MVDRYALIIGAMKAGTTTLFDHLAAHPAIAPSRPKEPGFFAFDDLYAGGRDIYHALFDFDPAAHAIRLDGSTDYAKFPHCGNVPARLRAFGGDFRLIYLLRHPLRRIESHAQHVQHKRREVGRNDSDRPDHSLDAGVSPVSLDISRYAMQLDQYADYFDRGALLVTSLERLSRDPAAVVSDVCRHIGVSPQSLPNSLERRNAGDGVRRAREVHPLWRAAASVAPARELVRAVVPPTLRDRLRGRTRPVTQARGRFALTTKEEARLLEQLSPDLRRLRDRYGFDAAAEWGIGL
jgi:transposase-like protein